MQLREQLTGIQESTLHKALAVPVRKSKRLKTDQRRKQIRGFWKRFDRSLVIINETPKSYIVMCKYGTYTLSKGFTIRDGLWVSHIDTWYMREHAPSLKKLHI